MLMKRCAQVISVLLCIIFCGAVASAQTGGAVLRGTVTDDSGAIIPGAPVMIISPDGAQRAVTTGADGSYTLSGLTPGRYTVRVVFPGFVSVEQLVDVTSGRTVTVPIALKIAAEKQQVTVQAEPGPQVSVEPDNNAGALVLRGTDLDALPDDPDDLAADLQALAGPSAGPNGGQMFIDGFSGGQLPPKESIREIRINQNPFSAEYDALGFGRIEVFTKPGTDKFRGQAFFNFSDGTLNSRNPYAENKAPYQSKFFGGYLSGPLSKKASFNVNVERRDINDNEIINGTVLDPSLSIIPYSAAVVTPNTRTSISPRIDYQLSPSNTLVGRYTWTHTAQDNTGVGQFSLLSRAYDMRNTSHNLHLTETAVLGPRTVNETRVQFVRSNVQDFGDNSVPAINVLQAFMGGGAQIGNTENAQDHIEFQNYTSVSLNKHTVRFGARLRERILDNRSPQNFGGTFTFGGGLAPALDGTTPVLDPATGSPVFERISSIQRYQQTLLLQQAGLSAPQIQALGYGPTQFSIAAGSPAASVHQFDIGAFVQDDWRLRPNFTLSLGLRYETQTNIHDWRDFGPRVGFAWSPDSRGGRNGKTVVRGGFGMFYDRFDDTLVLNTVRFNGLSQQQYIVDNPIFYPEIPPLSTLNALPQTLYRGDSALRAPYIMQTAIGIEHQLPWHTTVATTFTVSHAIHLLRTRNINAPLDNGLRPYGDIGNIDLYESTGVLNQNQLITNINSRVNTKVSLFAFYVFNHANSNTDGAGTLPANQYDLSTEYGRSSLDVRHRFVLGGSIIGPMNLRFSPFILASSGLPFNITTGLDNNGDTEFVDRPGVATDPTRPGVVRTAYGLLDPNPVPGEPILPRNFGDAPGRFTLNMRLSRTWGFGTPRGNQAMPGDHGGFGGGHGHGRGGGGGMRMGGMHGFFGDGGGSENRYNVTLSISARNLLNHVNLGMPIGNLTSPLFGQSNSLAGGYGPGGLTANNRRLELQLRFSF